MLRLIQFGLVTTTATLLLAISACGVGKADSNAHGLRLAKITGCISCHGAKLDGHLFEEDARFAVAWSSNLSLILPRWTDAQIEQTLRTGLRPDSSPLWFMPTFAHQRLSGADMRDLIGWLRTVPPTGVLHPPIKFGPLLKQALAQGFQSAADQAKRLAPRAPASIRPELAKGRYLAMIACAECHGPELKGPKNPQAGDPPDLVAGAAYSPALFRHLIHTGTMQNGKKAGLMGDEAPKRLAALTDAEVESIRVYLVARAGR